MNYPTRPEIETLSAEQRLQLIGDVWETFEAAPHSLSLLEEHRDLLEQRLAELEHSPNETLSLDEMLQQARG
jgi:putative addiction module component (TIGR02574 family)